MRIVGEISESYKKDKSTKCTVRMSAAMLENGIENWERFSDGVNDELNELSKNCEKMEEAVTDVSNIDHALTNAKHLLFSRKRIGKKTEKDIKESMSAIKLLQKHIMDDEKHPNLDIHFKRGVVSEFDAIISGFDLKLSSNLIKT